MTRKFNNPAFRGAYEKGRKARREGKLQIENPYHDIRTDRGDVTYSRAFRRYWDDGWKDQDEEMKNETSD